MRIVIAEKDQIGRRLLAQLLRMEGHDVLLIEEGDDARGLMNQYRPDMVLMDMFAPHQAHAHGARRQEMAETECLSPVVMMTSMGACEKLSSFMGMRESMEADNFDRLPANAKIGAMDHIQRICEALSRNMRASGKAGGNRPHPSSGQGLLDLYV